jgi:hypothetical protein
MYIAHLQTAPSYQHLHSIYSSIFPFSMTGWPQFIVNNIVHSTQRSPLRCHWKYNHIHQCPLTLVFIYPSSSELVLPQLISEYPALHTLMSGRSGGCSHTQLSRAWCCDVEVYISIPGPPNLDVVRLRCILAYPACHIIFSKLAKIMRIFVKVCNPKSHGVI